ncbi:hypothetical protein [Candidatus Magnetominusculus dajiuhuensis]|uniref:hypothetical protein n=1 Tax=Candidatus Magnetominusculus dajiuhuensis TaxID=3137712 RepID=UPI003B429D16
MGEAEKPGMKIFRGDKSDIIGRLSNAVAITESDIFVKEMETIPLSIPILWRI